MKRVLSIYFLFSIQLFSGWGTLDLRAQGIVFEQISLEEALKKATAENKYVFIDAFTVWCGPCKMLNNKTFPDPAVGAYYNQHFINLKMDMERGEGLEIARKYGVDLFPTLLFFNASGKMVHRVSGFYGAPDFIQLGEQAIDPHQNMAGLLAKYRAGERSPDLLQSLMKVKAAAYDPEAAKYAQEYLNTQKDLGSPENRQIIFTYADDPFSTVFKYFIRYKDEFGQQFSEKAVKERIDQVFQMYLETHPNLQLGEIQRLYGAVYPEQGEQLASAFRLNYFRERSNHEQFALSAVDHYQRFPSDDPDELNEMAWFFYQDITDPALLETALAWAQKSVDLSETYYAQETLAMLHQKLGHKKAAKKAATRAVDLANSIGEKAPSAQKLLEEKPK